MTRLPSLLFIVKQLGVNLQGAKRPVEIGFSGIGGTVAAEKKKVRTKEEATSKASGKGIGSTAQRLTRYVHQREQQQQFNPGAVGSQWTGKP